MRQLGWTPFHLGPRFHLIFMTIHTGNRFNIQRCWLSFCMIAIFAGGRSVVADDPVGSDSTAESTVQRMTYDSPQTQRWKIGVVIQTRSPCTNAVATFPIPTNWPEQEVELVTQTVDPLLRNWSIRELPAGAKQVVVRAARLPAGTTAELTFEFEIRRSRILPTDITDDLVSPTRLPRTMKMFTGNSPMIDTSNGQIKKLHRELEANRSATDWDYIEQIYDHVRDHVEYVEGPIRRASDALKTGTGDCEDMTSLFIALCRNARIASRMVWVPGHCYPEFYLEDPDGNGFWFPCQVAGTRQFGRMDDYRPVLQKGDQFKLPESRTRVRYIAEFFRCDVRGKGKPKPTFIREQL